MPRVESLYPFWDAKHGVQPTASSSLGAPQAGLSIPKPSPVGFCLAFFAVMAGFALVWHIWWLALAGLAGCVAVGLARAWQTSHEQDVSSDEIARHEGSADPSAAAA